MISALLIVYAVVRFCEAYGLWNEKSWAEWFAAISAAIYLPVETEELIRHPSPLTATVLLVKAGILVFLLTRRSKRIQADMRSTLDAEL